MNEIFLQADSAQAEARVVFLCANDEQALYDIDNHDYHALTASWFFGGTESDYSKKVLGYESPIRFAGKTLRHAGHLGAGKRRAAISVNTDARKYKIPIRITEMIAERALKIFHSKQPKIREVFHGSVIECLKRNRRLIAPLPYGIRSRVGGIRTFYERWGDELFREAFSYIPQRAITDNTKSSALRIKERIRQIKIVLESHDSLLFCINTSDVSDVSGIVKEEMERPISFETCSIPRRPLIIPCEIEVGDNYKDLKKFKVFTEKITIPVLPSKSATEQFLADDLPKDSKLTNIIYREQERRFEVE
jgi:DNA polymerase family A